MSDKPEIEQPEIDADDGNICFHCIIIECIEDMAEDGIIYEASDLLAGILQVAGDIIKQAPDEHKAGLLSMSVLKLAQFSGAQGNISVEDADGNLVDLNRDGGKTH